MKRAVALVFALAFLGPAAQLLAACSDSPCCASEETSMRMAMDCCEPAMCADPAPASQPRAISTDSVTIVALHDVANEEAAIASPANETPVPFANPPAPTRVRLARLSTLLI